MSTGSVSPFSPNGPTQLLTVTGTSQSVTFPACDALLFYNAGTVVMFIQFGEAGQNLTAIAPTVGTPQPVTPIPPGMQVLLGTGYFGPGQNDVEVAVVGSTSGPMYITPGLGTQH
jgi:hypothetical protein